MKPGSHVQLAALWLPEFENVSVGQLVHTVKMVAATEEEYVPATHKVHAYDPDAGLYVPSSHAVHGPPSGPEYPALHRHSATDVRPATLLEFVGQTVSTVAACTST